MRIASAKTGFESARLRPGGLVLIAAFGLAAAVGLRAQVIDWTIPDEAATLASPLTVTPEVIKHGAEIFSARCKKCHGPEGKGNGPYSDPKHPAANLTEAEVGSTPDGVLFYKIWNGKRPMPAFKTEFEKNDVWTVLAYVKTLSTPAPSEIK